MILPIELLEIVLHFLKRDVRSLSAFALTNSALALRAQQQIFDHVTISGEKDDVDNDNSILLALNNPKHAHLLQYIHSLTLVNVLLRHVPRPNKVYAPNPLIPPFVDKIGHQLTSLSLHGFAPGWEHSHAASLRTSITNLLSYSTTLTHFEADNVYGFSLPLLCYPYSLTSLRFATSYPSYAVDDDTIIPSDAPPIYLDALDIKLSGELPAVRFIEWILSDAPTSRLSVAHLRCLSMNGLYTDEVAKAFLSLLDECSFTLQHLSLGPGDFRYDTSSSLPNLYALETLQWKAGVTHTGKGVAVHSTPFNFLAHALTALPSPSPLQELDIQVQYQWWYYGAQNYDNTDLSIWDPLNFHLTDQTQKGKFPHLKRMSIGVGTNPANPDAVTPKDLFPMIRERFKGFLEIGAIVGIEFYDLRDIDVPCNV